MKAENLIESQLHINQGSQPVQSNYRNYRRFCSSNIGVIRGQVKYRRYRKKKSSLRCKSLSFAKFKAQATKCFRKVNARKILFCLLQLPIFTITTKQKSRTKQLQFNASPPMSLLVSTIFLFATGPCLSISITVFFSPQFFVFFCLFVCLEPYLCSTSLYWHFFLLYHDLSYRHSCKISIL